MMLGFKPRINIKKLRDAQLIGWGSKVAIIDSGVNNIDNLHIASHKDFVGTGYHDFFGHGTRVASIVRKLAPGAQIISAKIGDKVPDEVLAMAALEWAIDEGAKVINISCCFPHKKVCGHKKKYQLCKLVDKIVEVEEVLVIVAAGNYGPNEGTIFCPGCAENAITVGSVNSSNDKVHEESSRGRIGVNKPNILTTGGVYFDGSYGWGTSFATPIIAGIVAASFNRLKEPDNIRKCLYQSTIDLGEPQNHQGLGLFSLEKYLEVMGVGEMDSRSQG